MKCPFCQQTNPEDSVFCQQCGKKIPCSPTCGTVIRKRKETCENEGMVLPEEVLSHFPAEAPKPKPDGSPVRHGPLKTGMPVNPACWKLTAPSPAILVI